jgi:formamidopyrimidine-DNA glycosylase
MPELAEVEFFRRRWEEAGAGSTIRAVHTQDRAQVFRGTNPAALRRALRGATWIGSEASAKQMLFRFSKNSWLGVHLGMSGELRAEAADYVPGKHDHLVLSTGRHQLVFSDPRKFGRIQFQLGPKAPPWWARIAPAILSPVFTVAAVGAFLQRRRKAPIKAVLLMQAQFPGVGNWMADEILWRAAIHPRRLAGSLDPAEVRRLWAECRSLCRLALKVIAGRGRKLPSDLNANIPDTWLFNHRWKKGGRDPRTGTPLARAMIGGRTTCWSPARQILSGRGRR